MKRILFLLVCSILFFISSLSARIGENRVTLETRFLSKIGGAYKYSKPEESFREASELPYRNLLLIAPREYTSSFFFKRTDKDLAEEKDTLTQNDLWGWEIHIMFQNDKSILELYRKYGHPLTMQEVYALLERMKKPGTYWKKDEKYVAPAKLWELSYDYDSSKLSMKEKYDPREAQGINADIIKNLTNEMKQKDDPSNTKESTPKADAKIVDLMDILPMPKDRFIWVEIPREFKSSPAYQNSLAYYIELEEQRRANAKYKARQEALANDRAAKLSTTNTVPKTRDSKTNRTNMQKLQKEKEEAKSKSAYAKSETPKDTNLSDISLNTIPKEKTNKEMEIIQIIPIQDDTAFTYNYVLSDGSLRAKLYPNAVLVYETEFDQKLRKKLEEIYREQEIKRTSDAEDSLYRF